MIYGLTGASGVGKSTLANLVADSLDITYLVTSVTESARRHGYDPVRPMTLDQRIDLQFHLLDDHAKMIDVTPSPMITDRTPIDFIGYMIAEIDMQSHERLSSENMTRVSSYVESCLALACKRYDFLFHLAPLPFYEQAETRPVENVAYQCHVDLVLRGALQRLNGRCPAAILNTTDLDERQEFVHNTIVQRLDCFERQRRTHRRIH